MGVRLKFSWQLWGGSTSYQWKILLIHFTDTPVLGFDLSLDEDFELATPFISENFTDTFYGNVGLKGSRQLSKQQARIRL